MTAISNATVKPRVQASVLDVLPANAPAVAGYARTATAQAVVALGERQTGQGGKQSGGGAKQAQAQADGASAQVQQAAQQALQDAQAQLRERQQALAQAQAQAQQEAAQLTPLQARAAQAQAKAQDLKAAHQQAAAAGAPAAQARQQADAAYGAAQSEQQQAQAALDAAHTAFEQARTASPLGFLLAGTPLGGQAAQAQAQVNAAQARLDAANAALAAADAKVKQVHADTAPLVQAEQAARARWDAAAADAQATQGLADAQAARARQAGDAARSAQTRLDQAQDGVLAAARNLDTTRTALGIKGGTSATAQAHTALLQQAEQAVRAAQGVVHDQEKTLAEAQAHVADERGKTPALEAKAVDLEVQAAKLQGELAAANVPRAVAQRDVDAAQAALNAANGKVAQAQAKIAEGQSDHRDADGHHNRGRRNDAYRAADAKTALGQQMLAAAQQEVAAAQAQLDAANAVLAPLAQAAAAVQAQLDAATKVAADARAQVDAQGGVVEKAIAGEFDAHKALRAAQGKLVDALQKQADVLVDAAHGASAGAKAGIDAALKTTEQSLGAARQSIDRQEKALAAARASADHERTRAKPLDAKAAEAEGQANQLKAAYDVAQLAATQAQQKIDAAQAAYDGAAAEVAQAQKRVDAAIDQRTQANFHKHKGNKLRAIQEAEWEKQAAGEQLAAAQAKLEPLKAPLEQARADAAPFFKAALDAQAKWVGAQTAAGVLRGEASQQAKVAEQAIVLELSAQSGVQAAQTLYLHIGQIENLARAELDKSLPADKQKLADVVKAKEQAVAQASASLAKQEQTLAQSRAGESDERAVATPLKAQAAGQQLIAGNLAADAQASAQGDQAAQAEVAKARAELQAAKDELKHQQAELARGEVLSFRADYIKKPKKKGPASAQAQAVIDAAEKALPEARARVDQAEADLARALRRAEPKRADAQNEQLAAQVATQDALTTGSALAAQQGWVERSAARHGAADQTLASGQAVLVQAQLSLAQAQAALARASEPGKAKALAAQADKTQDSARRYAELAGKTRAAAAQTYVQELARDDFAVQAAAPKMLGEFLEKKVSAASAAYEQVKQGIGGLQKDFQAATQKVSQAAPEADDAYKAMMDKELDAAIEFARSRGAHIAGRVSAESMMGRARTQLTEQARAQAPSSVQAGPAGVLKAVPVLLQAPAVAVDEGEVRALAEQLAAQENAQLARQTGADKAAALDAWYSQQMSRRKTPGKQLHLQDDLAQFKEGNAEVKAARQKSLDTAQALKGVSQAAVDAGELVQDAVVRAQELGKKAVAAQAQLSQAASAAALTAGDAGAQAKALVQAHENEHTVLEDLLGEVKASGSQAQAANAQAAAELASQAIAKAKASAAEWDKAVPALMKWAQQQQLSLADAQQAIEAANKTFSAFAQDSAQALAAVKEVNTWAKAVLQEHADRAHDVQKLHEKRERQDAIDKNAKKKSFFAKLVQFAVMAAAAAVAFFLPPLGLPLLGTMLVAGAAGAGTSALAQGINVAAGFQDSFDAKSVLVTGLSAAATAGLFQGVGGSFGNVLGKLGVTNTHLASAITGSTLNAGVQGALKVVGLQKEFDWGQVAAAGLAAGALSGVNAQVGATNNSATARLWRVAAEGVARFVGGGVDGRFAVDDLFSGADHLMGVKTGMHGVDLSDPDKGFVKRSPFKAEAPELIAQPSLTQAAQQTFPNAATLDTLGAFDGMPNLRREAIPVAPEAGAGPIAGRTPGLDLSNPGLGFAKPMPLLFASLDSGVRSDASSAPQSAPAQEPAAKPVDFQAQGRASASDPQALAYRGQLDTQLPLALTQPRELKTFDHPQGYPTQKYTVQPGDTYASIAKKFGWSDAAQVMVFNAGKPGFHPDRLAVGRTVEVPTERLRGNPSLQSAASQFNEQLAQFRRQSARALAEPGGARLSDGPGKPAPGSALDPLGQTVSTRAGLPTGAPLGASPSAVAANVPAGLPAPAAYERVNSKGMQLNELAAKYGVKPEEIAAASGLKHFYLPPGDMEVVIPRSYLLMDAKFQQLVDYYKPQYEKYQASQKTGAPDTSLERGGLQETAGLNPLSPANYQNVIDPKTGQLTLQSTRIELNPPLSALELQKQVQAELNQKFQAQQQPTPEAKPLSQANQQNVFDAKTGQPRLQTTHIELGAEANAQRAQAQAKLNQLFQAEIQPAAKPAPSQANQQMVLGDNGWELKSTQIALDAGTAAALDAQGGPIGRPTSSVAGERGKAAVDRYQAGWQGLIEAGAGVVGATAVEHAAYGSRVNNDHAAEQALQRAKELGAIDHSSQIKNLGDFANYATGHLINSLPYIAEMVPGALTGGATLAARAALGATAQTLSRARALGGTLGGVAASYPSSVGEILQAQRQHGGNTDFGAAGLFGVFNAGFNAVGVEGQLFSGALFRNGIKALDSLGGVIGGTTRAGVSALKNAGSEGFAESVQDAITHGGVQAAVPNAKYQFDPESFIAGAAVGGPLAASGGWQRSEGYRPAATAQAGGFNAGRAGAASGSFASSAGTLAGSASSLPKTVIDAPTTGVGQIHVQPGTLGSDSSLAGLKSANRTQQSAIGGFKDLVLGLDDGRKGITGNPQPKLTGSDAYQLKPTRGLTGMVDGGTDFNLIDIRKKNSTSALLPRKDEINYSSDIQVEVDGNPDAYLYADIGPGSVTINDISTEGLPSRSSGQLLKKALEEYGKKAFPITNLRLENIINPTLRAAFNRHKDSFIQLIVNELLRPAGLQAKSFAWKPEFVTGEPPRLSLDIAVMPASGAGIASNQPIAKQPSRSSIGNSSARPGSPAAPKAADKVDLPILGIKPTSVITPTKIDVEGLNGLNFHVFATQQSPGVVSITSVNKGELPGRSTGEAIALVLGLQPEMLPTKQIRIDGISNPKVWKAFFDPQRDAEHTTLGYLLKNILGALGYEGINYRFEEDAAKKRLSLVVDTKLSGASKKPVSYGFFSGIDFKPENQGQAGLTSPSTDGQEPKNVHEVAKSTVNDLLHADPSTVPDIVKLVEDTDKHTFNMEVDLPRLAARLGKLGVRQEGPDLILYRAVDDQTVGGQKVIPATGVDKYSAVKESQSFGHIHGPISSDDTDKSGHPSLLDYKSLSNLWTQQPAGYAPPVDFILLVDEQGKPRLDENGKPQFRTYGPLAPSRFLTAGELKLPALNGTAVFRLQEDRVATLRLTGEVASNPSQELVKALIEYAKGRGANELRLEFDRQGSTPAIDAVASTNERAQKGYIDQYEFINGTQNNMLAGKATMPIVDIELYEPGKGHPDETKGLPNPAMLEWIEKINTLNADGWDIRPGGPTRQDLTRAELPLIFAGPQDRNGNGSIENNRPLRFLLVEPKKYAISKTPGLPESSTLDELKASGGVPGYDGIHLEGQVSADHYADLWDMSVAQGGIEFDLLREHGDPVLYSGNVSTAIHKRPESWADIHHEAHVHPGGTTASPGDEWVLSKEYKDRLQVDPNAPAPYSTIILSRTGRAFFGPMREGAAPNQLTAQQLGLKPSGNFDVQFVKHDGDQATVRVSSFSGDAQAFSKLHAALSQWAAQQKINSLRIEVVAEGDRQPQDYLPAGQPYAVELAYDMASGANLQEFMTVLRPYVEPGSGVRPNIGMTSLPGVIPKPEANAALPLKFDYADLLQTSSRRNIGTEFRYGGSASANAFVATVDQEGVLRYSYQKNDPAGLDHVSLKHGDRYFSFQFHAPGSAEQIRADLIEGTLIRAQLDGVPVKSFTETLSANSFPGDFAAYQQNLKTMSPEMAARNTKIGEVAARNGLAGIHVKEIAGKDDVEITFARGGAGTSSPDGTSAPNTPSSMAANSVSRSGPLPAGIREVALDRIVPMYRAARIDASPDEVTKLAASLAANGYDVSEPVDLIELPNGEFLAKDFVPVQAMQALHDQSIPARVQRASEISPEVLAYSLKIAEVVEGYKNNAVTLALSPEQQAAMEKIAYRWVYTNLKPGWGGKKPAAEKTPPILSNALPGTKPGRPRLDVVGPISVEAIPGGGVSFHYGSRSLNHYLVGSVDKAGVMRLDIMAKGDRATMGTGTEMMIALMRTLKSKGVEVKKDLSSWYHYKDGSNADEFLSNVYKYGMTPAEAAADTWIGRLYTKRLGFEIESVESGHDVTRVMFRGRNPKAEAGSSEKGRATVNKNLTRRNNGKLPNSSAPGANISGWYEAPPWTPSKGASVKNRPAYYSAPSSPFALGGKEGHEYARLLLTGGSPFVLEGHGGFWPENGNITVPQGVRVTALAPGKKLNSTIARLMTDEKWDELRELAESDPGIEKMLEGARTYLSGARILNYYLAKPDNLLVRANSTTVAQPILLEDIMSKDMGPLIFAACVSIMNSLARLRPDLSNGPSSTTAGQDSSPTRDANNENGVRRTVGSAIMSPAD